MKWNLDNPWFTRLVALFFAIILFSFVTYENQTGFQSNNPTDGASITGSEIIPNLPIEVNVDRDQYFVSGIPDSATIRLEGPQSVLVQTSVTRNFSIATPDLNELGEGTHNVPLQVEGLNSQLDYSLSPSEISLTIEEKQVEEHEVRVSFDEDEYLADGYSAGEPELSEQFVRISGASSTMEEIDDVLIQVTPEEHNVTEDIEMGLSVLVLNENQEPLDVNIEPIEIGVRIPVNATHVSLPIDLSETGDPANRYSYSVEFAQGEPLDVTVAGDMSVIEEMENFPVEVDISGVTETSRRLVALDLPEGVEEVDPEELWVVIRVNQESNGSEPDPIEEND